MEGKRYKTYKSAVAALMGRTHQNVLAVTLYMQVSVDRQILKCI